MLRVAIVAAGTAAATATALYLFSHVDTGAVAALDAAAAAADGGVVRSVATTARTSHQGDGQALSDALISKPHLVAESVAVADVAVRESISASPPPPAGTAKKELVATETVPTLPLPETAVASASHTTTNSATAIEDRDASTAVSDATTTAAGNNKHDAAASCNGESTTTTTAHATTSTPPTTASSTTNTLATTSTARTNTTTSAYPVSAPPPTASQCRALSGEAQVAAYEAAARAVLPPYVHAYYAYTAGRLGPQRVAAAFAAQQIAPVALPGLSLATAAEVNVGWEAFGASYSTPFMVAPTGFHRLLHPDGELAVARACASVGACYVYNYMYATTDAAAVAAVGGAPWASIYLFKDRAHTLHAVRRCEALGFTALVLTCDHTHSGVREATLPRFAAEGDEAMLSRTMVFPNALAYWRDAGLPPQDAVGVVDPGLSWEDVRWLKAQTHLPLVVKGVLRESDARSAVRAGVDGIIVSNHGCRQTDGGPAALDVFPGIALAVRSRARLFLDTGVRSGLHALTAVAHGATAVLVGRPPLWALAVDGEDGVHALLHGLTRDLQNELMTVGCPSLARLGPSVFYASPDDY